MSKDGRVKSFLLKCQRILPQVKVPIQRVSFEDQCFNTFYVIILYMILCHIKLFGVREIPSTQTVDFFVPFRPFLTSSHHGLMEFALIPNLTAYLISHALVNMRLLDLDLYDRGDKLQFRTFKKLISYVMTIILALVFVMTNMYGPINDIHPWIVVAIILQLIIGSFTIPLFEDLFCEDYCLETNALSLFIACNISEKIFWGALSPLRNAGQFEGSILAFVQSLFFRGNQIQATRYLLALSATKMSILSIAIGIGLFALSIYLKGYRVDLIVKNNRVKAQQQPLAIKLMYTSAIPLLLMSTLLANICLISQITQYFAGERFITYLLGHWTRLDDVSSISPNYGLAYHLSPPYDFKDAVLNPFRLLVYIACVCVLSGIFARNEMLMSKSGANDLAKQLRDQGMVIKGYRDSSTVAVLNRYIPAAALFGAVATGALAATGATLGAAGSAIGISLTASTMFDLYRNIRSEQSNQFIQQLRSMQSSS